jgi:hypothetical protein
MSVETEDDGGPIVQLSAKHRAKRLGRPRSKVDAGERPKTYGAETPPYEITIRPGDKEVETRVDSGGRKLTVIVKNRRTVWRMVLVCGGPLLAALLATIVMHICAPWLGSLHSLLPLELHW